MPLPLFPRFPVIVDDDAEVEDRLDNDGDCVVLVAHDVGGG